MHDFLAKKGKPQAVVGLFPKSLAVFIFFG